MHRLASCARVRQPPLRTSAARMTSTTSTRSIGSARAARSHVNTLADNGDGGGGARRHQRANDFAEHDAIADGARLAEQLVPVQLAAAPPPARPLVRRSRRARGARAHAPVGIAVLLHVLRAVKRLLRAARAPRDAAPLSGSARAILPRGGGAHLAVEAAPRKRDVRRDAPPRRRRLRIPDKVLARARRRRNAADNHNDTACQQRQAGTRRRPLDARRDPLR